MADDLRLEIAEEIPRLGRADVRQFALFPKAGYAAVGTINAAIVALAKAFADKGVADGVQVTGVLPGPVMTGRRESYLEKWAPAHLMTVQEARVKFPRDAGIERYGRPDEIAELMASLSRLERNG